MSLEFIAQPCQIGPTGWMTCEPANGARRRAEPGGRRSEKRPESASRLRPGCGWQTRDRETLPSRTAKMKAGVRHPAYPANKGTDRLFQPRATGCSGYAARCPFVFRPAGYRNGDKRLLDRPASWRDNKPPRSTAISERPAAPSNRRIGRLRTRGAAITASASSAGTMPVNRRKASRPRESRERIVPTGTSRTVATSP